MARNRTQWLAQTKGRTHATDMLAADEDEISSLCAHYNVPLVSMRSALVDAVREGAVGIPSFMNDCKHPSGVGHTFLAQMILQRILQPPTASTALATDAYRTSPCSGIGAPAAQGVPPPTIPRLERCFRPLKVLNHRRIGVLHPVSPSALGRCHVPRE